MSYSGAELARLEPAYLARFGLRTAPFPLTHDDRFLYLDAERQQLLNMLLHLTQYSQLLLLVIGEHGCGKTSLLRRFVTEAEPEWLISEVEAHALMDSTELLDNIARGFGMQDVPRRPADLPEQLYRHLAGLQHQEQIPVLVVDDAHLLPQEALEALFHLADMEASDGNLLRTILFCEPAITPMLAQAAIAPLRERITHSLELLPFDEEQSAEYLRHRLAVAGLDGPSPFSARDIKRIYKSSGGIPDKINEAAHLILNGEAAPTSAATPIEAPPLRPGRAAAPAGGLRLDPRRVVLGAVGMLLVAAVLLWQDDINRIFEPGTPEAETDLAAPTPWANDAAAAPPQQTLEFDLRPREQAATTTTQAPQTPEPPAAEAVPAPEHAAEQTQAPVTLEPAPATEPTPPVTPAPAPLALLALEPQTVLASDQPQTLTLIGEGFRPGLEVSVAWADQRRALPPERLRWRDATRLEFTLTVGQRPEAWRVSLRDPVSGERVSLGFNVQAPPAPVLPGDADRAWLLAQPVGNFTLQLLASHQQDSVQSFSQAHRFAQRTALFESLHEGRPWHALVYGSFGSREEAERASRNLPSDISPWVRSFASIHQSLAQTPPGAPHSTAPLAAPRVPGAIDVRDHAAWLWSQDPRHYTLQLLAGHNEAALQEFIRQHRLSGQAVYYRSRRDGRAWYVLVMGSYADREQAGAALQSLPADLRQGPWPRSFASIHTEMDRN